MENSVLQLTIREMKQQATSARFWAGLLGVVCILTVSAPFDTATQFNIIQRFFYWGGVAVSTYFCAIFVLHVVLRKLKQQGKPELVARIIASLVSAFTVVAVVFFINTVVVGVDEFHWRTLLFLGINCFLISLAVTTIFFLVNDTLQKVSSTANESQETPIAISTFYQRLPKALGTDIISLQAQDHYVEVKTSAGKELVLIRLSDAIKELGDENGIQVHRSWWVMTKHVLEQKRVDNKPHLVLSDGSFVPVSRTYSANVKAALS